MKYIAIEEHRSQYPSPVEFKAGEELKIGIEDTEYPGWVWVVTRQGNSGWAPISYIEKPDGATLGVANSDYSAQELNVSVGETIYVERALCGWLYAENSAGIRGWVPEKCLEIA